MKNQNTITKVKFYFSLEKEVEYINKMNQKGWKLVYIKLGIFYTFVKTEPDEYITILHTETKERLSEVAAFAAQCGYENIPHTMDGFGEVLYLTGKKSEVSPDFVSKISDQIESCNRLYKKFSILTVIYYILLALLLFETVFVFIGPMAMGFHNPAFVVTSIVFFIITAVFLCMTISVTVITAKMRKEIKRLHQENQIYE